MLIPETCDEERESTQDQMRGEEGNAGGSPGSLLRTEYKRKQDTQS
jgi:hypothetical protein